MLKFLIVFLLWKYSSVRSQHVFSCQIFSPPNSRFTNVLFTHHMHHYRAVIQIINELREILSFIHIIIQILLLTFLLVLTLYSFFMCKTLYLSCSCWEFECLRMVEIRIWSQRNFFSCGVSIIQINMVLAVYILENNHTDRLNI